jgi:hypothetical protein
MVLLACGLAIQTMAQNPPAAPAAMNAGPTAAMVKLSEERLKLEQDKLIAAKEKLELEQSKLARESWKDWAAFVQSLLTAISIAIAGAWVFLRFVWAQE